MESEERDSDVREEEWLAFPFDPGAPEETGTLSERRAHLWALVLEARYITSRIEPADMGWQLLVPAEQAAAARQELACFEAENRNWPPPAPSSPPLVENSLATLSILILLATFHNLTLINEPLFGHFQPDWQALGSAKAGLILDGQLWRLVTALTLHADWLHLFSNLAIGGGFVYFLCRDLGSGLAWSLLLGSGILGNLVNACVQSPEHSSIGSSTLVFGAVGINAALSLVRYRHQRQRRWALPVAAALALLALLGTEGKRTDLGAHLFGFVYGGCLGLVAEYLLARYGRPGRGVSALLSLASAVVVVAAWWAALEHGR